VRRSTHGIVCSHAGTLPQPEALKRLYGERYGQPRDEAALARLLPGMVAEVVRRQAQLGLAIVNDGEYGKKGGFSAYVRSRLSGLEERPARDAPPARDIVARDAREFPGLYAARREAAHRANRPVFCTGPIRYTGQRETRFDIDNLKAAARGLEVEPFLPAIAPGTVEHWLRNAHYRDDEELLFAIADAMHEEYKLIADAGIVLQVDDPDLPDGWQMYPDMGVADYRRYAQLRVEALNHALRGIPEEMVRLHVCWGSGHGPHKNDIPLREIVDLVLRVRAQCYSVEAANPRHEHEWTVWREAKLPEGKLLMPGVVGHASDVVEHPELVAQRLERFAGLVGRENVIAGTDCGLGGRVGHDEIAWAKLEALVEGARLATKALWPANR
jgi:5-methyltetrahydropteroyltriglutamate--homocysteine methyltransferase